MMMMMKKNDYYFVQKLRAIPFVLLKKNQQFPSELLLFYILGTFRLDEAKTLLSLPIVTLKETISQTV